MKLQFLILFLSFQIIFAKGYSIRQIKNEYKNLFKIETMEHNGKSFAFVQVDTLTPKHFLKGLVKKGDMVLDYLLQNRIDLNYDTLKTFNNNKVKIEKYFYTQLYADTIFTEAVQSIIVRYLLSKGNTVSGITKIKKETFEIEDITKRAVRFFYPYKLLEDGKIKTKICVGRHGLNDFEGKRNYLLEAFAFSSIFRTMKSQNQDIYEEYLGIVKDALHFNFSDKTEDKLKRIQGAAWFSLSKNKILINHISEEYSLLKDCLPFELGN